MEINVLGDRWVENLSTISKIAESMLDQTYAWWSRAELDCEDAYSRWITAGTRDQLAAFSAYSAALEREEAACRELRSACLAADEFAC